MRYQSESVLEKFIKGTAKFVLRLVVVALVLLIAVQFIMANTVIEKSLISKIPYAQELLKLGQDNQFAQQAKMVFAPEKKYIIFRLQSNEWPWQVRLVVNGHVVGNFSQGKVEVKVKEGDNLAVDARGYKKGLWLTIAKSSAAIENFQPGQQFWIKNQYKKLGIVKLKEKI